MVNLSTFAEALGDNGLLEISVEFEGGKRIVEIIRERSGSLFVNAGNYDFACSRGNDMNVTMNPKSEEILTAVASKISEGKYQVLKTKTKEEIEKEEQADLAGAHSFGPDSAEGNGYYQF